MPKLSQLTDYNEEQPAVDELPVENPYRRIPVFKSDPVEEEKPSTISNLMYRITNKLLRDDDQRYQLWPEKVIREALTGAGDVASGKVPTMAIDPATGDVHTSPQMIEKAQAISALAGTGGLGGVTDATLGATPFLRPALKYKEKLYKGKEGQQHMDVIPENLYPEFQKMAMSGEDISHYNFGFVNDKGHFLDREKALKYAVDTGMVDKFAGQYGALTSTLLADSSKPGMAIEAMAKANPFFSAVENAISKVNQPKMTGDQWLGTISNKPGVKPEELDWTGLRGFLEENKGKAVTKAQVEEHLAANKVELKEVSKGEAAPEHIKAAKDAYREFENYSEELANKYNLNPQQNLAMYSKMKNMDPAEVTKYTELQKNYIDTKKASETGDTKYHSYQLPGGENYREMLLTLPEKQLSLNAAAKQYYDNFAKKGGWPNWEDLQPAAKKSYLEQVKENKYMQTDSSNQYKSSHWDEPNILAHVRMNDRTIEGKKSLHLEEIQSDWHQQGRDKGYKQELTKNEKDELNKLEARNTEIKNFMSSGKNISLEESQALVKEHRELLDKLTPLRSKKLDHGVPDAPFKKNWHELALKRMIREAAEKGYDRLSWTPGEAQAARYDLSKQVDKIAVPMVNESGTRSVRIDSKDSVPFKLMVDKNGKVEGHGISSDQFSGKHLSDVVGKEMADKIMKLDKPHEYSGEGLKIGGEGMKGFYDQIIPKALEKLGKEHGVKVKQSKANETIVSIEKTEDGYAVSHKDNPHEYEGVFDTRKEAENFIKEEFGGEGLHDPRNSTQVHYIDIPQSLKDTALHKGFPLFSSTHMFTPVTHEPEFK